MKALVQRGIIGKSGFIIVAFTTVLFAVLVLGGALPAHADEGVSPLKPAGSELTAQADVTPQVSSKGSSYGLLVKNGFVYPCDKKGHKLADAWNSSSSKSATEITKLFVAANVKKVPAKVKYRVKYRYLGVSTFQGSLNSLTGKTKSVKFLVKGGKNACKTIEESAFAYSGKLTVLTNLKKTKVKTIGDNAFYGTGLKKVSLPKTLKTIGDSAFSSCTSLKAVKGLSKTKVTKIGEWVFNQTALKSVSLPKKCKTVNTGAFYQCRSLKSVSIGGKVGVIGMNAFYGCRALKKVVLPASVKELGWKAFSDCVNLASLTMKSKTMVMSTTSKSGLMTNTISDTKIADPDEHAYIYVPKSLLAKYQVPLITNPWYEYAKKFRTL